jgi:hypothetical protein
MKSLSGLRSFTPMNSSNILVRDALRFAQIEKFEGEIPNHVGA